MSQTVIRTENLGKLYELGEMGTGTLSHDLNRWWSIMRGKGDPYALVGETNDRTVKGSSDFVWAIKDIDFDVKQGEVLGIIGRNGAGKSTLLKILSKVTAPSVGSIKVRGRISSLLEVGTGFHPELTGRENVFLNGAILGMTKQEIRRKFDAIVDFSGVERYIDTPVKRYSSGMYVRLAFSVAAHLESEILIVDEVLAVGDADFQKKCLGKMGEISQGEGRTVLFVSHNMDAILRLCTTCIYLKNGNLLEKGDANRVISSYLSTETNLYSYVEYNDLAVAPGDDCVKLLRSEVVDGVGNIKTNLSIGGKIGVKIVFQVLKKMDQMICGFNLYNKLDLHILSSHDLVNNVRTYEPAVYETIVWLPGHFLAEGLHYCGIAIMSVNPFKIHVNDINKFVFNVVDDQQENIRAYYAGDVPGVVRPVLDWDFVKKIN